MKDMTFFEYCDMIPQLNTIVDAYSRGESSVDDVVYDNLYKQIKLFEAKNPQLILPESPTQRIGVATNNKVSHRHKMLSIANINSYDELRDWVIDKMNKSITELVIEYKIDGVSMSTMYDNNIMIDSVSRGDGDVGERCLHNAMAIDNIPKTLQLDGLHEIRGEVVWYNDDFIRYNNEQISLGKKPMVNPRNGAAGTMKLQDNAEVKRRVLHFIAYRYLDGSSNALHSDDLVDLKKLGFTTSPYEIISLNDPNCIDVVIDTVKRMDITRKSMPYITDGLVIKVNDKTTYTMLGGTAKCPHAFGAYKFPPEVKNTKLLHIDRSYGKTGAVTPVINVEPVYLSLTTVKRSSLHNWDMFEFMGFYDDCMVSIRKAGEIIPQVISVVGHECRSRDVYEAIKSNVSVNVIDAMINEFIGYETFIDIYKKSFDGKKYNLSQIITDLLALKPVLTRPTHCIHCGSQLINPQNMNGDDSVVLICASKSCPSLMLNKLIAFTEKDGMNIMNVGEKNVEQLFDLNLVKKFSDFYELKKETLVNSGEFSDREAERIIDGINDSRNSNLNQLLKALSLDDLGKTISTEVSIIYNNLSALNDAVLTNPTAIALVPKMSQNAYNALIQWFTQNQDEINYFITHNIGCKAKEMKVLGSSLNGLMLIMTGSSSLISRDDFKQKVISNGGKLSSSITGKVDYVVLCDGAGSKKVQDIKKIQSDGGKIKTITDQEFLNMIA